MQRLLKKSHCFSSKVSVVIEAVELGGKLLKKVAIRLKAKAFTAISIFVELVWPARDIIRSFRLASDSVGVIKINEVANFISKNRYKDEESSEFIRGLPFALEALGLQVDEEMPPLTELVLLESEPEGLNTLIAY